MTTTATPTLAHLDLAALRHTLQARRDTLRQALRPGDADRPAASEVSDLKDVAARHEADEVEDEHQRLELAELRDVEAALQRLERGEFGLCDACGAPIPAARLSANPAALRCVACQSAREAA